jgi:hypothetical protein
MKTFFLKCIFAFAGAVLIPLLVGSTIAFGFDDKIEAMLILAPTPFVIYGYVSLCVALAHASLIRSGQIRATIGTTIAVFVINRIAFPTLLIFFWTQSMEINPECSDGAIVFGSHIPYFFVIATVVWFCVRKRWPLQTETDRTVEAP